MNKKILILVEGSKTEPRLFNRLFDIYDLSDEFEIISFGTNIYELYNHMSKKYRNKKQIN